MSLSLTHFAVGAGMMYLALAVVGPSIRYRESLVVASGVWALVPDAHYVSPVLQGPLSQIKFTVFGNVFWFHACLDSLRQGEGTREGAAVALGLLLACAAIADRARATGQDCDTSQ